MLAAALLGMLALTAAICVLCGIVGAPIVGTLCSTAGRYRRWVPVLTVVIPGTCLGALLGATGLGFAVFLADPHGTIIAIGTGFILGVPVGLSVGTAIAIARFDWVRTNLRDALRRGTSTTTLAAACAACMAAVGAVAAAEGPELLEANWPPETVEQELGLSAPRGGRLEVRVWLGGGVTLPFALYRILETEQGVTVEHIAWIEIAREDEVVSAKEARRENRAMRRFLEREHCHGAVQETSNYQWCRVPLERDGPWQVLLADLLPDELWQLPPDPKRECGWARFDGEAVGIDIMQGERRHRVTYDNPGFCCPDVACAIANHVRHVVAAEIR